MPIFKLIKFLNTDPSLENEEGVLDNLANLKKKQKFYSDAFEMKFETKAYTKSQLIRVVSELDNTPPIEENPYLFVVKADEGYSKWVSLQYYDPVAKMKKVVNSEKKEEKKIENRAELVDTILNIVASFESGLASTKPDGNDGDDYKTDDPSGTVNDAAAEVKQITGSLLEWLFEKFSDTEELKVTRENELTPLSFSEVLLGGYIAEDNELMPLNRMITLGNKIKSDGKKSLLCFGAIDFLLREFEDLFQTSENPLAFCFRAKKESLFVFQKNELDREFKNFDALSGDEYDIFLSMVSFLYQEALKNEGEVKEKIAFCLDLLNSSGDEE